MEPRVPHKTGTTRRSNAELSIAVPPRAQARISFQASRRIAIRRARPANDEAESTSRTNSGNWHFSQCFEGSWRRTRPIRAKSPRPTGAIPPDCRGLVAPAPAIRSRAHIIYPILAKSRNCAAGVSSFFETPDFWARTGISKRISSHPLQTIDEIEMSFRLRDWLLAHNNLETDRRIVLRLSVVIDRDLLAGFDISDGDELLDLPLQVVIPGIGPVRMVVK
jgi:hypothetical protein